MKFRSKLTFTFNQRDLKKIKIHFNAEKKNFPAFVLKIVFIQF